jgi:hypothetical protein
VKDINEVVFFHFLNHFQREKRRRPSIMQLAFKRILESKSYMFVRGFLDDEVKQTVWDYIHNNCPKPGGVSFDFLKDFWEYLKGNFVRFMME